jgi:hypothetical protein
VGPLLLWSTLLLLELSGETAVLDIDALGVSLDCPMTIPAAQVSTGARIQAESVNFFI